MKEIRKEWFGNIKGDLLVGIVVCMVLILEVIGFFIVVGVDFMIGVYVFFCMLLIILIFGGRIGMILVVVGVMVLVLVSLVKEYGIEYMFLVIIFIGVF